MAALWSLAATGLAALWLAATWLTAALWSLAATWFAAALLLAAAWFTAALLLAALRSTTAAGSWSCTGWSGWSRASWSSRSSTGRSSSGTSRSRAARSTSWLAATSLAALWLAAAWFAAALYFAALRLAAGNRSFATTTHQVESASLGNQTQQASDDTGNERTRLHRRTPLKLNGTHGDGYGNNMSPRPPAPRCPLLMAAGRDAYALRLVMQLCLTTGEVIVLAYAAV